MEHAAQPVRESEARMPRNPARSGTRNMDLAQTIREAQQLLVERLDGVEHRLGSLESRFDRLETRSDRSEQRWEAWRELSEARWVDVGKEIIRKHEKLEEKIEFGSPRGDLSLQLVEHKREMAEVFDRVDVQYFYLRQDMRAGFAEMRELIKRGQRNTVIMFACIIVLLLTWLELRGAALGLFGG